MNAFKKFAGVDDASSSSASSSAEPSILSGLPKMMGGTATAPTTTSSSTGIAGMMPTLPKALGGSGASAGGEAAGPTPVAAGLFGGGLEHSACPSLSRKQRFMGFGICFGIGMLINLLATINIAKPTSFALLYSVGNIVSFLSTGFLVGPKRQCAMACERKRALATIIFFIAMIGTLLTALLYKGSGVTALCIFLIVIQFCALVWYTASYIPFAQNAIVGFCKSITGRAVGAG